MFDVLIESDPNLKAKKDGAVGRHLFGSSCRGSGAGTILPLFFTERSARRW